MLDDDVLAVSRYGAMVDNVRPEVGVLDNATLRRIFGKDNRLEYANWRGNGNNAILFINAINALCRN